MTKVATQNEIDTVIFQHIQTWLKRSAMCVSQLDYELKDVILNAENMDAGVKITLRNHLSLNLATMKPVIERIESAIALLGNKEPNNAPG